MRQMFNLEGSGLGSEAFRIQHFLNSYMHFFRSTMIYESVSMTGRTYLYYLLAVSQRQNPTEMRSVDLPISFAIGALMQGVGTSVFYSRHLINHDPSSQEMSKSRFVTEAKRMPSYWIQRNPLVWVRGGQVGVFSLFVNEKILNLLEFKLAKAWQKNPKEAIDRQELSSTGILSQRELFD